MGTSSKAKTCSFSSEIKRSSFISSKEVKAKSQSVTLSQIEHLLNSNELDLIRRARNKSKRYPKSSDPTIYSRATGFETLIGWLFLKDPQRLSFLFEYLEKNMQ